MESYEPTLNEMLCNENVMPWHQPRLQRLMVNLDTAEGEGSAVDCATHSAFLAGVCT
jgi:hypothetical protein